MCGGCWDVCRRGPFIWHLPSAEGRALQVPPLSASRWPGSRTTDSKSDRGHWISSRCIATSNLQYFKATVLNNNYNPLPPKWIVNISNREKYLEIIVYHWEKAACNTYMPAGLADSADGETVCSRSGVWPSAWPCMSAGPSGRSERGSRGAENSPVGDSQDSSPLLAYSSSIWVVVRLRAWGTRIVWLNIQLTHKSMDQLVSIPSPTNNYCGREEVVIIGSKIIREIGQNRSNKLEVKYVSKTVYSISDAQHSTLLLGLDSPHNFIRSDASVLKQSQGFPISHTHYMLACCC